MVKSRSNKKRCLGKNKSKKNVKRVRKTMKKMMGGISYKTMRTKLTEDDVNKYLHEKKNAEGDKFKSNLASFIKYKSFLLSEYQKKWITAWGVDNNFIDGGTEAIREPDQGREALHQRPKSAEINFGETYGKEEAIEKPDQRREALHQRPKSAEINFGEIYGEEETIEGENVTRSTPRSTPDTRANFFKNGKKFTPPPPGIQQKP